MTQRDDDKAALTPVDRDALERCLQKMLRDPEWRGPVAHRLEEEGWFSAARFACYSLQCDTLGLRPWQSPPCWAGGGSDADATRWRHGCARPI